MQKISRREASVILGKEASIFAFIGAGSCLWNRAWLLPGALIGGGICWWIWDAQRKKYRCHSCRSRLPYFLYEQSADGTVYCPECGAELELTQSPKFSLPIPKKRSPVIMAGWLLLIGALWGYAWQAAERYSPWTLGIGTAYRGSLAFLAFYLIPIILHRYLGKPCPHCGGHVPNSWMFRRYMGKKQNCCTHCGKQLQP